MLSLLPSGLSLLLVARPCAPATPSSRAPVSSLLLTPARLRVLREPSMQESGGEAGAASTVTAAPAYIEFMVGVPEPVVPDVKLTRSRDGTTGVATFTFDGPSFLLSESADLGETTGMYLKDEEGTLKTTEVTATFVNGKPRIVKGVVIMKGEYEWDRFMRWMERYAESNGLGFSKA